jgi:hypothetical protein
VVLGDSLEELHRLAAASQRPEIGRLRKLVTELGRETAG